MTPGLSTNDDDDDHAQIRAKSAAVAAWRAVIMTIDSK